MRKNKLLIGIVIVGALAIIGSTATDTNVIKETTMIEASTPIVKTEKELHQEWIEKQFSGWDGSHIELVKLVKNNLNDPKSFEHSETKFLEYEGGIMVFMDYRAKNGFGALIKCSVSAFVDKDKNILIVESK